MGAAWQNHLHALYGLPGGLIVAASPEELVGWKKRPRSRGVPRHPEYEKFEGKFLLPLKKKAKVQAKIQEQWTQTEISTDTIAREVIKVVNVIDDSYKAALTEFENSALPESFLALVNEMRAEQEPPPDPLWVISELIIHINTERKRRQDDEETLAFLLSIIH